MPNKEVHLKTGAVVSRQKLINVLTALHYLKRGSGLPVKPAILLHELHAVAWTPARPLAPAVARILRDEGLIIERDQHTERVKMDEDVRSIVRAALHKRQGTDQLVVAKTAAELIRS